MAETSKVDPTAALRQQRRRDRLKEIQAQKVVVVLSKEQIVRLDGLVISGYAPDRPSALVKGMDEAFERLNEGSIRNGVMPNTRDYWRDARQTNQVNEKE